MLRGDVGSGVGDGVMWGVWGRWVVWGVGLGGDGVVFNVWVHTVSGYVKIEWRGSAPCLNLAEC